MVGMQDHHGQWWEVVEDCAVCGQCCIDMKGVVFPKHDNWVQENGVCKYLDMSREDIKPCLLYPHRPYGTCTNNNPHTMPEYCKMKMEKINEPLSLL
jgi:hypothetical protein